MEDNKGNKYPGELEMHNMGTEIPLSLKTQGLMKHALILFWVIQREEVHRGKMP